MPDYLSIDNGLKNHHTHKRTHNIVKISDRLMFQDNEVREFPFCDTAPAFFLTINRRT
jgi:hypothetical protein